MNGTLKAVLAAGLVGLSAMPALGQGLLTDTLRPVAQPQANVGGRQIVGTFDDWHLTCPVVTNTGRSCEIGPVPADTISTDAATVPGDGPVRLVGRYPADNERAGPLPVFIATMPLGMLLSRGLRMQVGDNAAINLAIRSCHADAVLQGCVAPFQLTPTLENQFRRGLAVRITSFNLDGTSNQQDFSLIGFTRALEALSARAR